MVSSYLHNKSQLVSYNNTFSETKCITCGVPQVSLLGPLLFLLYINISSGFSIFLFADDINIFLDAQTFMTWRRQ